MPVSRAAQEIVHKPNELYGDEWTIDLDADAEAGFMD
jgi:hypothetical protein